MNMTWEKIVFWIIAAIVIGVVIVFLVAQLKTGGSGAIGTFFGTADKGLGTPIPGTGQ